MTFNLAAFISLTVSMTFEVFATFLRAGPIDSSSGATDLSTCRGT